MAKVNVNLREAITTPANVTVTVRSMLIAGQSVVAGTAGVLPGEWKKRTGVSGESLGVASFVLMMGRYEVTASSSSAGAAGVYKVVIDVDDSTEEFEHTELIVEGAEPFSQPIPGAHASEEAYGTVQLADGAESPARIYSQAQVDALIELVGSAVTVDTIADAQAMTRAQMAAAKVVTILGGAAAYDGGGGVFHFQAAGVIADNSGSVLRPSDFATFGTGNLRRVI